MSLFDQNLQWLQQNDPELAQRVRSGLEDADIILQRSRTGMPNVLIQRGSRISLCIIPMIRLNIPGDHRSGCRLPEARNLFILGSGMGYLPLLIVQNYPNLRHVYIVDPSISVFRRHCGRLILLPCSNPRR